MRFPASLFLLLISGSLYAQTSTVSGIILDEMNMPVYAANIYLKETPSKGVISDFNGKFSFELSASELTNTLVISFISYITQHIKLCQERDCKASA